MGQRVSLTMPKDSIVKHIEEEFYRRYPTARIAWDECSVSKDDVVVVGYICDEYTEVPNEVDGTQRR